MQSAQSHLSFAVSLCTHRQRPAHGHVLSCLVPAAGPGRSPHLPSPRRDPTEQTLGDLPDEVAKLKMVPLQPLHNPLYSAREVLFLHLDASL